MPRHAHTYVELEVSTATYDEITAKLRTAQYDHVFMPDGVIDMQGIALTREVPVPASSTHGASADSPDWWPNGSVRGPQNGNSFLNISEACDVTGAITGVRRTT